MFPRQAARLDSYQLVFQFLSLVVSDQGVDNLIERAVHNQVELMQRKADAMIADAVLFEVVSADFFGAVAAANH